MERIAEVLYPSRPSKASKIAAWISGVGNLTGAQRKRFELLLPPGTEVMYLDEMFRIELDVPPEERNPAGIRKLVTSVCSAIQKGLSVQPGLCPVGSNAQILAVTRRG